MKLPPLPPWDGIHPLIVHFPIALLLVAPVLVLVGLLRPQNRHPYWMSALVLMVLGTVAAYAAVASGQAGAELVDRTPQIDSILERHEAMAESVRLVFTLLTAALAVIVLLPAVIGKSLQTRYALPVGVLFLAIYAAAGLVLVNTGHDGARMVHELGVQAMMGK